MLEGIITAAGEILGAVLVFAIVIYAGFREDINRLIEERYDIDLGTEKVDRKTEKEVLEVHYGEEVLNFHPENPEEIDEIKENILETASKEDYVTIGDHSIPSSKINRVSKVEKYE